MKVFKKLLTSILTLTMVLVACLSLTACEDIKKLEVKASVVDSDHKKVEYTLTIDLYRHLAPKTVDAIIKNVNNKVYDGTTFYMDNSYSNQIMVGDYKFVNAETIVENTEVESIPGEFTSNGVKGTDLTSARGYIGLWRTWSANGDYKVSDDGRDTGASTWFMPTTEIPDYDGYFTVFAKIDIENNQENSNAFGAIASCFSSSLNYKEYVVYYTGTYDNLVYHCVPSSEFKESEITDLFKAEGSEFVKYNKKTIRVPFDATTKTAGAEIISVKVI